MHVLLATDGSSYSRQAARFLATLLRPDARVEIDLVAIRPPEPDSPIRSDGRGFRPAGGVGLDLGDPERWMDGVEESFERSDLHFRRVVREGDPAREIVKLVRERSPDLVVAGAKGCGATPFFELGHVARALLQDVAVPTLLVRKGGGGYSRERSTGDVVDAVRERPAREIRTVLAATSDESREGLSIPSLASLRLGAPEFPILPVSSERGFQPREVDREARRSDADLLILDTGNGARSRPRIAGGTVQAAVWTAPCSVLILRSGRNERARPRNDSAGSSPRPDLRISGPGR